MAETQNEKLPVEKIIVELESLPKPTDLSGVFSRPAPVELEVGIGKGGFLLEQAKARGEVNFFGIEWANEFFRFSADRYARWGLTNIRVMRTDARAFFEAWLSPACLDAVHVYFPDPWPKKRHHKRRFFRAETIEAVVRALKPGGRLFVATDHAEYWAVIQPLLSSRADLEEIEFPTNFAKPGEVVGTNFERKYIKEGRTFYKIALRKR
ncbi:MAG: tRNA (guanosine(46)-N7)-methyltransferase TrmB [Phycisphaerae bacterium]|nr:tRNA (guanosine(46)-N7)-methyltransferase TrmB [Phycisphaerae bacterium]